MKGLFRLPMSFGRAFARAAYYHSIGRPDFNPYAGGVMLPNTDNPPSATNRITVNNAGIKAWTAKSRSVRLEYYFGGVGLIFVGAFRRDFSNAVGGTLFTATPQFLTLYGLDPGTYGDYDVWARRPRTLRLTVRARRLMLNCQRLDHGALWTFGVKGTF